MWETIQCRQLARACFNIVGISKFRLTSRFPVATVPSRSSINLQHKQILMQVTTAAQLSKDPDLTILVPTYKRAQLLPSCLLSIAGQSRKDLIKEVIVSENSNDMQSKVVVNSFSNQLPIRYIQQTCGFTAQQHGIWLAQQVETKYVATIADDDMWSRYHIEEAMRCFKEHPTIHAFFGQVVVVENETCHPLNRFSGSFLQIPGSNSSNLVDFRIWDSRETAINCLANTPLNIWAVVALADAHRFAINSAAGDPVFGQYPSNDRLYIWRISLQGDIAIGRNISLFYRRHSESDVQTNLAKNLQEFLASDLAVSKEIARQADLLGINIYQEWQREYKSAIQSGLAPERIDLWNPLIRNWLLNDQIPDESTDVSSTERSLTQLLKKLTYLFAPPILELLFRKFRIRLAKSRRS
jgi:glycosyltransferase involved in cell wall biosynthesis